MMHKRALRVAAGLVTVLVGVLLMTPSPSAPNRAVPVGFSVGYDIFSDSETALARDLDAIAAAGAAWVRLDVDWSVIQAGGRDSFDWAGTDRVIAAARARNLQVDAVVDYAPEWAATGGGSHPVPDDPATYGTFAGQAARHYAGNVAAWEMGNEPNLAQFFGTGADPVRYAQMMTAAYPAIKAVVPDVPVLSAGLAPATDDSGDISPITFIRSLYAHGAQASTDAIAVHPYTYPEALPSQTQPWNAFYQLRQIHEIMVAHGDAAKRIWLTEFGAPTSGARSVTERRQADMIRDALDQTSRLGYLGPVFVYNLRDSKTGSKDREENFGVLHTDFSPKPSYAVLQRYARAAPL